MITKEDQEWLANHDSNLYAIGDMVAKAQKYRILAEVIYAFGKHREAGENTTLAAMKALEDWDLV